MDKEIPCVEMTSRADDAICEKRCSKKRSCGKHKCGNKCCIDLTHNCTLTCGKTLTCGLHRFTFIFVQFLTKEKVHPDFH